MNDKDLEKQIASLKNLPQYKNYSEEQLKAKAIEILEKKETEEIEIDVEWIGLSADEVKKANKKYQIYIKKHNIESFSDKEDLRNLIQQECIYEQLLEQIHAKSKKKTTAKNKSKSSQITSYDINALKQLNEVIISFKSNLGLSTKKKETWKDFWIGLVKRIMFYIRTHSGQFQMKCPYCQQMVILMRRIKDYDTFKFTMFKGTYLYNEEMMKDIESGKLTEEDVVRYWGLEHTDYIKGIYEEIYLKEKAEKENQDKLDKKIKETQ